MAQQDVPQLSSELRELAKAVAAADIAFPLAQPDASPAELREYRTQLRAAAAKLSLHVDAKKRENEIFRALSTASAELSAAKRLAIEILKFDLELIKANMQMPSEEPQNKKRKRT